MLRSSESEPTNGWVRFRIRVPQATRVAVVIEHEFHEMNRVATVGETAEWTANVFLRDYFGRSQPLNVSAVFPESENNRLFTALLEYLII